MKALSPRPLDPHLIYPRDFARGQPRDAHPPPRGRRTLAFGVAVYGLAGGEWLFLIPLLLVPYLSILGYVRGPRVGAVLYNAVHNWALAGVVVGSWLVTGHPASLIGGPVLTAHVGVDRLLGYPLKYPRPFRDTPVGWIGRG